MLKTIKSYVLRTGRVSPRQQAGLDNGLTKYSMPESTTPWNMETVFNRVADTVVEIGFGMGDSLLQMAENNPQLNYVGIEVHRAGVGSLVAGLEDKQLTNVRVVMQDAVEVLNNNVADNALAGLQLFFPDPWPKKRHHKRRLIQPAFVALVAKKIKPGGYMHCATDWEDYAHSMLAVLSQDSSLSNQQAEGGFIPRPDRRPVTKFERRGERLGHGVWDVVFIKT